MHAREEMHDPIDDAFESRFDAHGNWIRPPVDPVREAASRELGAAIQECLEQLARAAKAVSRDFEREPLPDFESKVRKRVEPGA